jgi:hypothetical protein
MQNTTTSFADALARAHGALLQNLRSLEDAVGAVPPKSAVELAARLGVTRAQISQHFCFEEQNGYLDAVRKREPRLEHRIQELAADHGRLLESLDKLVERARAATGPDPGLREDVKKWVDSVRQHEARENELVQDAFNFDFGAED